MIYFKSIGFFNGLDLILGTLNALIKEIKKDH